MFLTHPHGDDNNIYIYINITRSDHVRLHYRRIADMAMAGPGVAKLSQLPVAGILYQRQLQGLAYLHWAA